MKERTHERRSGVMMLFVEDDSNDIFLIGRALSKTNVAVAAHFVRSLDEMREYLLGAGPFSDRQKFPVPQVIVTDYRLCGSSAKDVIHSVRGSDEFKDIPVVVFSSFMPPREIDAMMAAGANVCLEKPAELADVCAVLQRAVSVARN